MNINFLPLFHILSDSNDPLLIIFRTVLQKTCTNIELIVSDTSIIELHECKNFHSYQISIDMITIAAS